MARASKPWLLTGVLLAASSLVNAAWFVLAGDDGGRTSFGAAGITAVGIVWASAGRTPMRALGRSICASAAILAGCAVTLLVWAAYVKSAEPGGGTFVQALGLADNPARIDGGEQINVAIEIDPPVFVAWAGTMIGVAWAGLTGRVARRARSARQPRETVLLAAPFALIAATALIAGAWLAFRPRLAPADLPAT